MTRRYLLAAPLGLALGAPNQLEANRAALVNVEAALASLRTAIEATARGVAEVDDAFGKAGGR